MSVIILDEEIQTRMAAVKQYALDNRISIAQIRKTIAREIPPAGDDENRVVHFKGTGLRLVLTLEEQPIGWCWHISASIPRENYMPDKPMMLVIMREFGIDVDRIISVWPEPTDKPQHVALNMLIGADNMDPSRN